MSNKVYTICLACGTVQARTDIITSFGNKPFVMLDRKIICPKCRTLTQNIATKDVKQLKKTLESSESTLAKKLNSYIR